MVAAPGQSGILTFSTNELSERDRVAIWREVFGRSVAKVDLELISEDPFVCESRIRPLPGVTIWSSLTSGEVTVRRTSRHVADGDDNFVLNILRQGRLSVAQGGREILPDQQGGFLWSNAEKGVLRQLETSDFVSVALSCRALKGAVKNLDDAVMRLIPASTEPLRLLGSYIDALMDGSMPASPELFALSSAHIGDLAALALGATRDAAEAARTGGLRAARLQAVKDDILANLTRADLSPEGVAARQGISSRYIRDLFSGEQTTFGDFVREQRLLRAHRMLGASGSGHRSIGETAKACGFGDISHFNHCFRRRFGETPSDVRQRAKLNRAD